MPAPVEKRSESIARWRVGRLVAALLAFFRTNRIPALGFWEYPSPLPLHPVPDLIVLLAGAPRPACVYLGQPLQSETRNDWLYDFVKVSASVSALRAAFGMTYRDAETVLANTDLAAARTPSDLDFAFFHDFRDNLRAVAAFRYDALATRLGQEQVSVPESHGEGERRPPDVSR
jgi:hypothetical protein